MPELSRVRRELRTLSKKERELYFNAIKIMRNTSTELGRKLFGERFREYDFLVFKHAVSALNECADQGHLPHNVITFHRALLLEFELSVLSVANKIEPSTSLQGIPYWNWFIDIRSRNRSLLESSVWKWWGSPYGDPQNSYCIHDPVFETKVLKLQSSDATITNPKIDFYMNRIFGPGKILANGYGYLRDPGSASSCPTIARNPGWAANRPISSFSVHGQATDCKEAKNFFEFSFCTSGLGINEEREIRFGPHFAVHVFMGTFNDSTYMGLAGLLPSVLISIYAVAFFSVSFAYLFCNGVFSKWLPSRSDLLRKRRCFCRVFVAATLIWGFVSLIVLLLMPTVAFYSTGVDGLELRNDIFLKLGIPFAGYKRWRKGELDCPKPGTCVAGVTAPSSCRCAIPTTNKLSSMLLSLSRAESFQFSGSDFWSGAYSPNENFFFSYHAMLDLMHFVWLKGKIGESENASLYKALHEAHPRYRNCHGTSLDDDISGEMCFTINDVGFDVIPGAQASGSLFSIETAESPASRCLTHNDILHHTVDPRNRYKPYAYDVTAHSFNWYAVEPTGKCPESKKVCAATFINRSFEFTGSILCINTTKLEGLLDFQVVSEYHCTRNAGREKPKPPTRTCNCKFESNREKTIAERMQNRVGSYWEIIAFTGLLASPLIASITLRCNQLMFDYTPLPETEQQVEFNAGVGNFS